MLMPIKGRGLLTQGPTLELIFWFSGRAVSGVLSSAKKNHGARKLRTTSCSVAPPKCYVHESNPITQRRSSSSIYGYHIRGTNAQAAGEPFSITKFDQEPRTPNPQH